MYFLPGRVSGMVYRHTSLVVLGPTLRMKTLLLVDRFFFSGSPFSRK